MSSYFWILYYHRDFFLQLNIVTFNTLSGRRELAILNGLRGGFALKNFNICMHIHIEEKVEN